jgi:NADH-quinone oxidoreductase subunit L
MFSILPVSLAAVGILFAAYLYKNKSEKPAQIAQNLGGIFTLVKQKFYVDEIYLFITHKIIFNLIGRPAAWIDKHIVDGFYSLTATTTNFTSSYKY